MTVPLHFINEALSTGVKLGGGSVSHLMTEVEISCLPKDLPEYIEVDIEPMELNDMLHLRDLKLPEGVEIPGFEAQYRQRSAGGASARPACRRRSRLAEAAAAADCGGGDLLLAAEKAGDKKPKADKK